MLRRMALTPEQRKTRARLAANARWSRPFARLDQSAVMKSVAEQRYRDQVDPDGNVPPHLVEPLIAAAKRAHSARMNLAKSKKN